MKAKKVSSVVFKKEVYFDRVHEVINSAKIDYFAMYSDKRKGSGYRTKLYGCNFKNANKLQKAADKLFPYIFIVKKVEKAYWGSFEGIAIQPIKKSYFEF